MTKLVQRSTDFVRSALLEHLRFESHVEARALTQQPRGQQWRVIRVSGDMPCGFLEFGEGNDRRRSNLGRHGGSLALHDLSEQLRQADLEWRDVRTWTPGEGRTQDFRPRFPWAPALDNASRDVHDPVVRAPDALEQLPLHRSIGARGAGREDLDRQEQALVDGPALEPAALP